MPNTTMRAYRIQLSGEGIQLFLRCHDRLCRSASDLLSYGSTLYVAVALMDQNTARNIADALRDPRLAAMGGRIHRYVGSSRKVARIVENIVGRTAALALVHPRPPV